MYLSRQRIFDVTAFRRALEESRNPIGEFRSALRAGRDVLAASQLRGAPAREIVRDYAWLCDRVVRAAWRHLWCAGSPARGIALVAVGGYGREELHPHSDIDVMILLGDDPGSALSAYSETLIRFLWDIGLEVGHSVRTVDDCVEQASGDLSVVTNLMESRFLEGDESLFHAMQAATASPVIWPVREFLAAKLKEQSDRDQRFDDTGYKLEPNVKESPGGLRDVQMIGWVAQRHFGTRTLKDLIRHGFLTAEEYRTLLRGRNFLWKLRNGLHLIAGRREDRLLFDYQRTLARQFGFEDRVGHLAVEQMMKRYYRTVREVRLLNEILLQHFQEAILAPRRHEIRSINDRFQCADGFLEIAAADVFENTPSSLLELFLLLQQDPDIRGVRASTIRILRANLFRIDGHFRRDPHCRALFMEIFRQPSGLTRTLRRMNAYGVLGRYIPVFGRVVGQMQHDLFHVYTVDAHALFVVRNLRRFAEPRFRGEFPEATTLMGPVLKKERLYLAGLFHDIAKGRGGDHSVLGATDARDFCLQHGMSEADARFVAWLVRHHLAMSSTAQREDISDPEVVSRFAELVRDQEHLDNLYLLTIADIRGTNPTVWNAWKGRLLADLYTVASRALRLGLDRSAKMHERVREGKKDALEYLAGSGVEIARAESHWKLLDDSYLLYHDPETVAWHARRVADASVLDLPLVAARSRPEIGGAQFLIYAPDADDLLSVAAGSFERFNLNIADARIHASKAGLVLLAFVVLAPQGRLLENPELEDIRHRLRSNLLARSPGGAPTRSHLSRQLKAFPIQTRVEFSDSPNGRYTIMELTAQDRPGLLYRVSRSLMECKVRLSSAKIYTFGERAEDVFFITDRDGLPIDDPAWRARLRASICRALGDAPAEDTAPVAEPPRASAAS